MYMRYDCLIVDDEKELAQATSEYFNMFEVKTATVQSGKECLKFLSKNEVDVILLDINLENESGFELCRIIRRELEIPILFISARKSDDDVLLALNIGGDDYINKPYSLSILLAKVKAVLKRLRVSLKEAKKEIQIENLRIELDSRKVYVNGVDVVLKTKEFHLLCYLIENKNRVITKEELFSKVWGDSFFSDGTLNVHIRHVREKIEKEPNKPQYIKTVWGTGYMFEAK